MGSAVFDTRKGLLEQVFLALHIDLVIARGWRRHGGPSSVAQLRPFKNMFAQVVLYLEPEALVLGLLLHTNNIVKVGIFLKFGHKRLVRKGVDLLDSNNGYIVALAFSTLIHEVVVDLSLADRDPLNLLGLNGWVDLANNRLKLALRELF